MGNAIASKTPKRLKPSHGRQWLALLALLAAGAGSYDQAVYRSAVAADSFPRGGKSRFLVLRLPEMPSNPLVAAAGEKRLEAWLTALQSAGYNLVPFTQALAGVSGAAGLPAQAMVLVFDPGYRSTYDSLAPILARHHVPAAWITQGAGVEQNDLRFLSRHRLSVMEHSGLWEVGRLGDSTMTFTLDGRSYRWGPDAGRYVLNGKQNLAGLNRLNVNLSWTGPQLLAILRAMAPVQDSCLTTGALLGQRVGVVKPAAACGPADAFVLEAAPDAHAASISWRGASSIPDFSLIVEADSMFDDLMLFLRYDPRQRQGIALMFAPKTVSVMQVKDGEREIIATQDWTYSGGQFIGSVSLSGRRLDLGVGGAGARTIELPELDGTPGKNIKLQVYSKLRGVAQAKSVRLLLTPL